MAHDKAFTGLCTGERSDNRLYDTGSGNIGINSNREVIPMFDRRKALIDAAVIVDDWKEKLGDDLMHLPPKWTDLLTEVLEQHLQRIFFRGYNSAVNPNSPDNQESE